MSQKSQEPWNLQVTNQEVRIQCRTLPPNMIFYVLMTILGLFMFIIMGASGAFDLFKELKGLFTGEGTPGVVSGFLLIPILFLSPFILLPLLGLYMVAASLLNTWNLRATPEGLSAGFGPLPWLGGCRLKKDQIIQLFCQTDSGTHCLKVLRTGGTSRVLLPHIPTMEQAWAAEAAVEGLLGIRDREVQGETADPQAYKSGQRALKIPPKGMKLTDNPEELVLEFHGERITGTFLVPFGLIWTSLTATGLGFMLFDQSEGRLPFGVFFFIGMFVLIGLGMLYSGLVSLINHHRIHVTPEGLTYEAGPLPWTKPQEFKRADIAHIERETSTHRTSKGSTYTVHRVLVKNREGVPANLKPQNLSQEAVDLVVRAGREFWGLP